VEQDEENFISLSLNKNFKCLRKRGWRRRRFKQQRKDGRKEEVHTCDGGLSGQKEKVCRRAFLDNSFVNEIGLEKKSSAIILSRLTEKKERF
jgi:hypothetical protein